mgnify:CR=1 FL=1
MSLIYRKHKENETYQLIPGPDFAQNWHIRILEGNFEETVIEVGTISYNETNDDVLTFNFEIVETPDNSLTIENIELQITVGEILEEIITAAIENDDGSIQMKEKET